MNVTGMFECGYSSGPAMGVGIVMKKGLWEQNRRETCEIWLFRPHHL